MGKTLHIETDHTPIVPLPGTKDLDEMQPRIQGLRMRLLRFEFTISLVPGRELKTRCCVVTCTLQVYVSGQAREGDRALRREQSTSTTSLG